MREGSFTTSLEGGKNKMGGWVGGGEKCQLGMKIARCFKIHAPPSFLCVDQHHNISC